MTRVRAALGFVAGATLIVSGVAHFFLLFIVPGLVLLAASSWPSRKAGLDGRTPRA
jgi:hypothetical protein